MHYDSFHGLQLTNNDNLKVEKEKAKEERKQS